ncbi:DUF3782 domain-containing protein [Desulfobacterales bacterium HSG2]|nr:DUF3782 domain-containing protein [Desulfobacterales bacterium HSG2]
MNLTEVKELIYRELPHVLQTDKTFHYVIRDMLQESFADRQKTEDRFDLVLAEIRALREESQRRWDEQQAENRALREESQRRWDKQHAEIRTLCEDTRANQIEILELREESRQILREVRSFICNYNSDIGALGAIWGIATEESFRGAFRSILEKSFGVQVMNINEFDHKGEVFGHPEQIELDVIIKNGLLIICEIRSSMSKNDMYVFDWKVAFYEKHHNAKATRRIVVSPIVNKNAYPVAEKLGIEVFSYAQDVPAHGERASKIRPAPVVGSRTGSG